MEITLKNSKPGERKSDKKPHRVRLSLIVEADSPNHARELLAEALNSKNGKGTLADALLDAGDSAISKLEWTVW